MEHIKQIKYKYTNKLSSDIYLLIPKGLKYFLYFTYKDNEPVCLLYKNSVFVKYVYISYNIVLSLGTILYGTLINNEFIVEKLILYKNKLIKNEISNLDILLYILTYEINKRRIKNTFSIKLPYITKDKSIYSFSNVPYTIYSILEYKRNKMFLLKNLFSNFIIKQDTELFNVYNLYLNNGYYNKACVNDIKTSEFLNNIFKNKLHYMTNEHSDEESDEHSDEESDEHSDEDIDDNEKRSKEKINKYVTCIYIPELKKWKPYEVNSLNKVDDINHVKKIETYYI